MSNSPVILAIINYFSYAHVSELISGLSYHGDDLFILIVDNGDTPIGEKVVDEIAIDSNVRIKVLRGHGNVGYLGGARVAHKYAMDHPELVKFKWFVISNADIRIRGSNLLDCLDEALSQSLPGKPLWVAPSIISTRTQNNQNPYLRRRPARVKYLVLSIIFSFYPLALLYRLASILKSKVRFRTDQENILKLGRREFESIYAGHGSFIALNSAFFLSGGHLNNEVFLFCEENFLAEQLVAINGLCVFVMSLKVEHDEHVTTGIFPSRKMMRYLSEAHLACYRKYMN